MDCVASRPIPGGWSEREVRVGSHTFRLLLPTDPDELLSQLIAAEVSVADQPHLADPYWAKLWPAATHLAEVIVKVAGTLRVPSDIHGTRSVPATLFSGLILELGCGSGLAGLAALACGCEVTFSDYVPLAVDLALENARRNGLAGARGLVLDWRDPPALQFPLIIAADVTYDRSLAGPLLATLDRMLAPGGEAWLADGGRSPVGDFLAQAARLGFHITLLDEADQPTATPAIGRCQRIVLRR